jgi:hypothetical protein
MIRTTLVALALIVLAGPARAVDRWAVGFDTLNSTIGSTTDDGAVSVDERAPGGAFQVAYRLDRSLLLRIWIGGAEHPTSDPDIDLVFAGGTLDLCYLFRPGAALRPYVFGGLGGYSLFSQQDAFRYEVMGPGAVIGVGVFHRLGRRISLHGSARYEAANWERVRATLDTPGGAVEVETPVEDSGSAAKLTFGVVIHL